jgi:hypothetical protein
LVYEGYPLLGVFRLVRRTNADVLGIPPVRDVYFGWYSATSAKTSTGDIMSISPFTNEYVIYNMAASVTVDYRDLQQQVVNYVADRPSLVTPRLEKLILKPIPVIRYGAYRVRVNYVIPGINIKTSGSELELFNKLPDIE